MVVIADTVDLTTSEPELGGRPATPGELITIFGTGMGRTFGSDDTTVVAKPVVSIDGLAAEVVSATAVGQGVYKVDVRVPEAVNPGDRVPVMIEVPATNGRTVRSNRASIAIAPIPLMQ
jgi:uncharacterized protein (TIGR03437 family)